MVPTYRNGSATNGSGPGHDTGFPLAGATVPGTAPRAEAPSTAAALRAEICALVSSNPPLLPDDAGLLALMGLHDAGIAAALSKLPEREGVGGAALAALVRKYRGTIDPYTTCCEVATTLIFWPEPVPADEPLCEAVLRLAEFNLDAARELARASLYLGTRFTLKHSVRVVLEKYGIRFEQFSGTNALPAVGLTEAAAEALLAQGQLERMNDMLRPFEISIRQKIGSVNPVFSLVEKNNGRAVMPTRDLIEFLRKRNVFA